MTKIEESWTYLHDLALLYITLAYGTDHRLSDTELHAITSALCAWNTELEPEQVQEVVLEAAAVFLEEYADTEVIRSIQTLSQVLTPEQLRRALEQVMQIAEADGVLLTSERSIVSILAELWDIKATGKRLIEQSTVESETFPSWTLMHDIGLICVVVAHSTDNELSEREIGAIIEKLHEWQPGMTEEEIRQIIRQALEFYATEPDKEALSNSVQAIRDTLPVLQRLALLDDLVYIARSDEEFTDSEREMITSLSQAWKITVRLD